METLSPYRLETSTPTWKTTSWSVPSADDLGDLKALKLGEARVSDLATLGKRLRQYTELLEGKPLRVRLVADDNLRYEPAARIIADLLGRRCGRDPTEPTGCNSCLYPEAANVRRGSGNSGLAGSARKRAMKHVRAT